MEFGSLYIPTEHSVCYETVLDQLVKNRRPAMLIGSVGTSKSAIIESFLATLNHDIYVKRNVRILEKGAESWF
jgi:hypothetical protein